MSFSADSEIIAKVMKNETGGTLLRFDFPMLIPIRKFPFGRFEHFGIFLEKVNISSLYFHASVEMT